MRTMLGTVAFAFLAGLLSVLSPCVLPLVPIVLGTAAAEHRLGPLALAAGLAIAFTAIGLFVATVGFAIGLDGDVFRSVGAILMVGVGIVLVLPRLQARVATAAGPVGAWAEERFGGVGTGGLSGQFTVGLLLGAAWSPCVGPTLGAASLMAARGQHLGSVALTMLAFGIGAALPLMLLGFASREALMRWRGGLAAAGRTAKAGLGLLLIVLGLLVLSGLDKRAESAIVAASPDWLNAVTTRY
jgi:cytochrome c biogenesis protein CcdA